MLGRLEGVVRTDRAVQNGTAGRLSDYSVTHVVRFLGVYLQVLLGIERLSTHPAFVLVVMVVCHT